MIRSSLKYKRPTTGLITLLLLQTAFGLLQERVEWQRTIEARAFTEKYGWRGTYAVLAGNRQVQRELVCIFPV
jgi:hypothetical protein